MFSGVLFFFSLFSISCVCRGAVGGWAELHLTPAVYEHTNLQPVQSVPALKTESSCYLLANDFATL